jgi:hypothetical protein
MGQATLMLIDKLQSRAGSLPQLIFYSFREPSRPSRNRSPASIFEPGPQTTTGMRMLKASDGQRWMLKFAVGRQALPREFMAFQTNTKPCGSGLAREGVLPVDMDVA